MRRTIAWIIFVVSISTLVLIFRSAVVYAYEPCRHTESANFSEEYKQEENKLPYPKPIKEYKAKGIAQHTVEVSFKDKTLFSEEAFEFVEYYMHELHIFRIEPNEYWHGGWKTKIKSPMIHQKSGSYSLLMGTPEQAENPVTIIAEEIPTGFYYALIRTTYQVKRGSGIIKCEVPSETVGPFAVE